MTDQERHQAELAAKHAERVAVRLEGSRRNEGAAALRMFAGALRGGAHLRPPGDEAEAAARQVAIVQDILRQGER